MVRRLSWIGLALALVAPLSAGAEWITLTDDPDPASVRVLESSPTSTVLEFRVSGFERTELPIGPDTYVEIDLPGESRSQVAGHPALPDIRRSLVVPDDARLEIQVLNAQWVDLPATPVAPSRGVISRAVDPATVPYTFAPIYERAGHWPAEWATLGEPYILRDFRGVVTVVSPFQYDAQNQTLRVCTSMTVSVDVAGPGTVNVIERDAPPSSVNAEFARLYARHFENWGETTARYAPLQEVGDMLIIAYDAFVGMVEPLAEWKNQMGIDCEVVPLSATGGSSSQIADYIQDYYDAHDLAFVLLVGDAGQIPSLYAAGGASDPSYVLLAGSDSYPDAFIGRLSANNAGELLTQVDRLIAYERDPMVGASAWYRRGMGVGSNQGPGDDGEYDDEHLNNIRADLLGHGFTHVDQIYDPYGSATQVRNGLDEGRTFINYTGHGWEGGWGSTGFSTNHVNQLVNDEMLPFIVSVACVNGAFTSGTCFAEAWLRATHDGVPTGAIGTYMSTINQSWNSPMCGQDAITDLLVDGVMETYGGLCFSGSCQMMDEYGSDGRNMFKTWLIFGDPSLRVRTDTPYALSVTHPEQHDPGLETFDVTVAGVEGALCALSLDGACVGAAFTDGSGFAAIPVDGDVPEDVTMTLTVTAPDAVPHMADVYVGPLAIPAIALDPDHFELEIPIGGTTTELLRIANTGEPGSTLRVDISVLGTAPEWLHVDTDHVDVPFGDQAIVVLSINGAGLFPGTYFRTLQLENNAGEMVEVQVLLGVGGAPVDVEAAGSALVTSLSVELNRPNPFRSGTTFHFATPAAGPVVVEVFDVAGRRVARPVDQHLDAGRHEVSWTARDASGARMVPGVYYYRVSTASEVSATRRLLLVR